MNENVQQSAPLAILATGLRKSFGEKVVLDGIDIQVAEGTIFSLLGPNGAGKTTTVRILSTLIPASGGQARIAGYDVRAQADRVRAQIGVTGQFSAVDDLLTGTEGGGLGSGRSSAGRNCRPDPRLRRPVRAW